VVFARRQRSHVAPTLAPQSASLLAGCVLPRTSIAVYQLANRAPMHVSLQYAPQHLFRIAVPNVALRHAQKISRVLISAPPTNALLTSAVRLNAPLMNAPPMNAVRISAVSVAVIHCQTSPILARERKVDLQPEGRELGDCLLDANQEILKIQPFLG
jgi:hypothetical protein